MPSPNAIITNPNTESVRFKVIGVDDNDVERVVAGTVTISDYTHAYVVKGSAGEFFVRANPNVFPTTPGSSLVVSLTFNCVDANGTVLPVLQLDITLQGPAIPSVATKLKVSEGPTTDVFTIGSDPGSATITY